MFVFQGRFQRREFRCPWNGDVVGEVVPDGRYGEGVELGETCGEDPDTFVTDVTVLLGLRKIPDGNAVIAGLFRFLEEIDVVVSRIHEIGFCRFDSVEDIQPVRARNEKPPRLLIVGGANYFLPLSIDFAQVCFEVIDTS